MTWGPLVVVALSVLAFVGAVWAYARANLLAPGPQEALVLSGSTCHLPDGKVVGYRVVLTGRAWRVPFRETVARLDLSPWEVELPMRQVRAPGRPPLEVTVVAQVRLSSDPQLIGGAVERYLGASRQEIQQVANHTIEGHLRAAWAEIPPDAVDADLPEVLRAFQAALQADLHKLGFELGGVRVRSSGTSAPAPAGAPPDRRAVPS